MNKKYIAELNLLNNSYQAKRLELLKSGCSPEVLARLAQVRRELHERLNDNYGDDLSKLNKGVKFTIAK